jgi:hypothetical protein
MATKQMGGEKDLHAHDNRNDGQLRQRGNFPPTTPTTSSLENGSTTGSPTTPTMIHVNASPSNLVDDADFLLKVGFCGIMAIALLVLLIGTAGTGYGSKYTHLILAYAAPLLITMAVFFVVVPIVMLVSNGSCCGYTQEEGSGQNPVLSTFERMNIENSLNRTFKGRSRRGRGRGEVVVDTVVGGGHQWRSIGSTAADRRTTTEVSWVASSSSI